MNQSGHITILSVGLAMVAFAIGGLAIDGTKAFIMQRTLQNAADAAAVTSANEIDRFLLYRTGGAHVALAPARAGSVAIRMVSSRGLRVVMDVRADEDGVTIVLDGTSPTSFLRLVGIEGIPVSATARAEPFPQRVPIGR